MGNILEVSRLSKRYKTFTLKDVSFSVPQGGVMGFVGPNGAGKTTTIKAILNMIHTDGGSVALFGAEPGRITDEDLGRIGVVMDQPFYVDDWSVRDVERTIAPFYAAWDGERFKSLLMQFGIETGKKVKELSRGMKVKLMLAAALSHNARLLVLDEPSSGLDPVARDELMDIIRDFIADERNGVLFSTHITSDLEKIADHITFINGGGIVFTGPKDALMSGYVRVKGNVTDISAEQKARIIGLREHGGVFDGMVATDSERAFESVVSYEQISLEDIVVFMNRESKTHE